YVPDVDSSCHHYGLAHERTTALLFELDQLLTQLSRSLPRDARLVITADHGLLDVPHTGHLPLTGEDSLMAFLDAPPSGDGRMPIFHVRAELHSEFHRAFEEHFGEGFALLDSSEAEQLGLFGPKPLSVVSRQRFGDFVGIALGRVLVHYEPRRAPLPQHVYLAQHAGLTPEELLIPLIVA
ncbi:MAG TPA: alkaline phosphatase family protein, partial [Polyangiaceae bacterium]